MPDNVASSTSPQWRQLPPYSQPLGVAGILAGQHGGVLIAAGGANFPGKPPWEGGKKVYYDDISVLRPGASEWQPAGRLPEARGYSAVVSTARGVLVIGGENAARTFSDCLLLRWTGDRVVIDHAAELPSPLTSPVAEVLAGKVYLAGGYGSATPRESTATFLSLDLSTEKSGWQPLPAWPGPTRAQAVMAAVDDSVFLISGLELKSSGAAGSAPHYLTDAYRYRPGSGWEKLPELPCSVVAAPSPAPTTTSPARVFVLGGVDGRQVGKLPRDARLPNSILCFDIVSHQWQRVPGVWPDPVVTVPAVRWNDAWTIVSGEIMAGVRTPNTWEWTIPKELAPVTTQASP
ncbi:hypothetical protein [Oleiharenicola lentus]|uniref:hypothetical protein n=1 Tax=Oleiharenicola lentus TaxID=2508720 RepID=UPI003F67BE75